MFGWMERIGLSGDHEQDPVTAPDGMLITGQAGLLSDTPVATSCGWRLAGDLRVGDRILTFDHGFQPVRDIQRETMSATAEPSGAGFHPVLIPKGAIGNAVEIRLMPDQGVLVESEAALDIMNDPFAVIPAQTLKGFRGIRIDRSTRVFSVTTIACQQDEVVYVVGGILAFCPRPRNILTDAQPGAGPLYDVLKPLAARYIVRCLSADNDARGLVCDPVELAEINRRGRAHLEIIA